MASVQQNLTGYNWTGPTSGQRYQEWLSAFNLGQIYTPGQAAGTAKNMADEQAAKLAAEPPPPIKFYAPIIIEDGWHIWADTSRTLDYGTPPSGSSTASQAVTTVNTSIKVATPDIIQVNQEELPIDLMTNMIFENIGGQELLSLSRHDLITGSGLQYQPISNLNDIAVQNNSHNIIPMPDSANNIFKNFPIKLETHLTEVFTDLDSSHIWVDNTKKELIIEVTGLKPGEQIEVEVLSSVEAFNDTIYDGTII